MFSIHHKY